ncbi:EPIDERMAL PATTERNING FACTOR-like protein 4 [Rhodamnia argentea]|uniref:Epidermal patterning factor-like protein n=1 Tax=Rhodamnia argentea TaxID=178133 RepID=A0A8B8PKD2_9MYRT|nr:EPIDERMAL PATTERNING FACTOR-like protein 4 [Rhodamnia argentea]
MDTSTRSRGRRTRRRPTVAALVLLLLLLTLASARPLAPESVSIMPGGLPGGGSASGSSSGAELERAAARRLLVGPGSAPPSCRSRCGSCSPCNPVHVPVQPGLSAPLEYYPEAWRCKCGNKLFMP